MSDDQKEIPFVTGCPVLTCPRAQDKNDPCYWKHSECHSSETINDKGMVRCTKCGDLGLFVDLEYKCRLHDDYYNPKSVKELSAMLSIVATLPGGESFSIKLLELIMKKKK